MKHEHNLSRLKAAGLIVPGHEFSDEDLRAIESLTEDELNSVLRVADAIRPKLAPKWPDNPGALRGIIL